nr:15593_t:CDS:2 [Entrophospora candida]CAG8477763.1 3427_t:CDS:2 [Entrophospora candida]
MQIDRSDKPDTAIKLSDNMQIEEIFLNQEETKEVKGGKNGKKTNNIEHKTRELQQ